MVLRAVDNAAVVVRVELIGVESWSPPLSPWPLLLVDIAIVVISLELIEVESRSPPLLSPDVEVSS